MAIKGETGQFGQVCHECGCCLDLQVLQSAAGYYIGTACACGPYSRESGYYPNREDAQAALDSTLVDFRTTNFNPKPMTIKEFDESISDFWDIIEEMDFDD